MLKKIFSEIMCNQLVKHHAHITTVFIQMCPGFLFYLQKNTFSLFLIAILILLDGAIKTDP